MRIIPPAASAHRPASIPAHLPITWPTMVMNKAAMPVTTAARIISTGESIAQPDGERIDARGDGEGYQREPAAQVFIVPFFALLVKGLPDHPPADKPEQDKSQPVVVSRDELHEAAPAATR